MIRVVPRFYRISDNEASMVVFLVPTDEESSKVLDEEKTLIEKMANVRIVTI